MRNTLVIGGVVIIVVGIGALIFIYSGQNLLGAPSSGTVQNIPAAVAVPFTELAYGTQSDVKERKNYLITSMSGLEKLWKIIDAKGKVPAIDFTQNSVVAAFAGNEPTGGYTISISKIEDTDVRTVNVVLTKPGNDCILTESTTAPYQVIQLPQTSLSFTHEDQATTTDCNSH